MVITTKIVFDSNWNVLEHEWFDYTGPVALCCGAPSGQTALAAAQTAAYTQYTANAAAEFQDATGLFKQLTAEYTPIFQAGPNQYGFSAAETNALNTEAASGTAQDYNAVNRAAKETLAAEGGGNTTLPSGVSAKMAQATATAGGQQLASEQQQIAQAGYNQGYQEWEQAAAGLGQAESIFGTANSGMGVATSAGSAANSTYNDIASENTAAFSAVTGALSGAAKSVSGFGV